MKILFTASKTPFGRFIRWIFNEDCSHVAINFEEVVFHSNLIGVHLEWKGRFLKNCKVVHEAEVHIPLEYEEKIWLALQSKHGRPYDYLAAIYLGIVGLRHKFFGTPIPGRNPWGGRDAYLCMELIWALRPVFPQLEKITDLEIVTPHKLFAILNTSDKEPH